jgi:hypothetical protein
MHIALVLAALALPLPLLALADGASKPTLPKAPDQTAPRVLRLQCVKPTNGPNSSSASGIKGLVVRVDGKEHNPCPTEFSSLKLLAPALESGASLRAYKFANVATKKDVEKQMRELGMNRTQIKKYSGSVHRSVTSTVARRIFLIGVVGGVAQGAKHLYELSGDPTNLVAVSVPEDVKQEQPR